MQDANETPFLAIEAMLYCELIPAVITLVWETNVMFSILNGDLLVSFILGELCA